MSSDNALVVIGNRLWNISASDAWETDAATLEEYVAGKRAQVFHCHGCALDFIARHDGFGDDAYAEYGVWLVKEEGDGAKEVYI